MNGETFVTLAGFLLTFIASCYATTASVKKSHNEVKSQLLEVKKDVNKNREHDREQYLAILRLTVMSEEMPISERIIAGKKYIDEGGNGDVRDYYYNHLLPEHTK